MTVNAVGVQPKVGYEKPKQSNSVPATIVGGGAGALGGYLKFAHEDKGFLNELKKIKHKEFLRERYMSLSDGEFEAFWKYIKDDFVKVHKEFLKYVKKDRIKFVVIGGLIGSGIGYIGSKLFGKKEK